jgi:hypothetical protein
MNFHSFYSGFTKSFVNNSAYAAVKRVLQNIDEIHLQVRILSRNIYAAIKKKNILDNADESVDDYISLWSKDVPKQPDEEYVKLYIDNMPII